MPESGGVAAEIVAVMRQLAGKHPGFRPVPAPPLRLVLSDDPVLLARSAACSISYNQRTSK